MSDTREDLSDYVRRVRENTQKYLRDLLAENEKLCTLVHTLERELEQHRRDRLKVEERIDAIEAERRAYLERYLEVEAQNAHVSNLYVATLRLHASVSRADVLRAIHEIVINLIGSEELAIFEVDLETRELRLASSEGVDPALVEDAARASGVIRGCARSGLPVAGAEDSSATRLGPELDLTACVPMVVEGVVTGLVAIFRLLRHKPRLEPIDQELLCLLTTQASVALYSASILERTGQRESLHARATSVASSGTSGGT